MSRIIFPSLQPAVDATSATSLANRIAQETEEGFPIIWEIFLGDGYGDSNRAK